MKKTFQKFGLFLLILSVLLSGNFGSLTAYAAGPEETGTEQPEEDVEELYESISLLQIEDYSAVSVTLSWFSDGNNDGFHIYRKSKYDEEDILCGTVENIPYETHYFTDNTFLPGIRFTYRIVAYHLDSEGNEIEGVSASESIRKAIPKAALSSVSRSGGKITVKWKRAKGVSGYEIYRKVGSGSYERAASIDSEDTVKWTEKASYTEKVSYKVRPFVKYKKNVIYGTFSAVRSLLSNALQKIVQKFKKLQKQFPSGKYWNHVKRNHYSSNTVTKYPCTHKSQYDLETCNYYNCPNGILGFQCYGFAWKMSDLIYGKTAKIKNFRSFAKCRMGDVIRYSGHSVIVTEKHKNYVIVGECNYGNTCMILWGRKVYKAELKHAKYSRRVTAR